MKSYKDIDGWFDFEDIYDEMISKVNGQGVFVELGAWLGKSTIYLSNGIKNSGKEIKFFTIDTWKADVNDEAYRPTLVANNGYIFELFAKNVEDCDVKDFVTPLIGTSWEKAATFADESVDFVFVDASHHYEDVKRDLLAWYPKIKKGGVLAGHDYWHPPIRRALTEVFADKFYQYHKGTSGSTWRVDKP